MPLRQLKASILSRATWSLVYSSTMCADAAGSRQAPVMVSVFLLMAYTSTRMVRKLWLTLQVIGSRQV